MMKLWLVCLALVPAALALSGLPSEYHDILGSGTPEWRLAFRGTAHIRQSVYDAYMKEYTQDVDDSCKGINWSAECQSHYRNNDALDNWYKVREVLFAVIKDGVIVKHIVFNGSQSEYDNWFAEDRVLDSCYTDLEREPKNYFSFRGQGGIKRRFFINRNYDKCDNNAGWFVALDGPDNSCNWERDTGDRPVFIYAAGPGVANWNSDNAQLADAFAIFVRYWPHGGSHVEYHDILNTGEKEWRLAFRATNGAGYPNWPAYQAGTGIPDTIEPGCSTIDWTAECKNHYRNNDAFTNWVPRDIDQVMFAIVDGGAIVKYITFNGLNTNQYNWFHFARIAETNCWSDFKKPKNFFAIAGHNNGRNVQRTWFINHKYGGCPNDFGWVAGIDNAAESAPKAPVCSWAVGDVTPTLYYSAGTTMTNWNVKANVKIADAFVVFIKYQKPNV